MKIFSFKINFLLIILVGVFFSGIYFIGYGFESTLITLSWMGHGLAMTAGIWIGCMTIVNYLWKKFPWEFYPVRHLLWEVFLITVYTIAYSFLLFKIQHKVGFPHEIEDMFMEVLTTMLITYLITAIHELVFFYQQWRFHFSKSVRLEKDNIQAKYETLKTQINPHFLFNSLNSLTSLVDDNKKAVEYIGNLSGFFRYMLSSQDKELVLVREEIKLLERYISLQQSRFTSTLFVDVRVPEKFYHFAIPPLVLQMLVENSIKHNIISKDKPLSITVIAQEDAIVVENNLQRKPGVSSTGTGLKNISERYKLFTTREIVITETTSIFKVSIPLLTAEF